jgi:hypothetical protein
MVLDVMSGMMVEFTMVNSSKTGEKARVPTHGLMALYIPVISREVSGTAKDVTSSKTDPCTLASFKTVLITALENVFGRMVAVTEASGVVVTPTDTELR